MEGCGGSETSSYGEYFISWQVIPCHIHISSLFCATYMWCDITVVLVFKCYFVKINLFSPQQNKKVKVWQEKELGMMKTPVSRKYLL